MAWLVCSGNDGRYHIICMYACDTGDILVLCPEPLFGVFGGVALDTVQRHVTLTRIIGSFRIDRDHFLLCKGYLQANYTFFIARKSQRGLNTLAMASSLPVNKRRNLEPLVTAEPIICLAYLKSQV
jgi:hypothetical protein